MLSIQDVGTQIISHNPGKFYVMCGTEYGIKDRYLSMIEDVYGSRVEASDVASILKLMRSRHIIPLQPALYVIRYDKEFISSLSSNTMSDISNTNIVGTIVCIYEDSKHYAKCEKWIPELTVSIDEVNDRYVLKYLASEFPSLNDRLLSIAAKIGVNYGHARNVAKCMSYKPDMLANMSDGDILQVFGCNTPYTDSSIRQGVANRNFDYLCECLSDYPDSVDQIFYTILATMIELDKIQDNRNCQSDIRSCIKLWARPDIYYMFMHTYSRLKDLRYASINDPKDILVCLFSLLTFRNVPSLEDLSC
jgi:hypothetical protein